MSQQVQDCLVVRESTKSYYLNLIKFVFLILLVTSFNTESKATEHSLFNQLEGMSDKINREPSKMYNQLIVMQLKLTSQNNDTQALYYLRKLQAENLLYLWDDFDKSLLLGLEKISQQSPLYLKILYKTYHGLSEQRKANYLIARQLLLEAVALAESTPFVNDYVYALQELAYTQSLSEKFETALIDLHKAHTMAINSNNLFMMALVEESYGAIFSYMGNYEKSLLHYNKALIKYRSLGYVTHEAETLLGMGMTYRHSKQWKLAVSTLNEYKEKTKTYGSEYSLFYANYGLAMTYADQKHLIKAKPYIEKALGNNGPDDYNAELYKQLALCYAKENKINKAFIELKKAQDIFEKIPELDDTSWSLETISIESQLWKSAGNPIKAYALLNEYHTKTIELLRRTSSERLYQMQLGTENERKDLEIAGLKNKTSSDLVKLEAQLKLHKKQQTLNIILFVLFITLLIFYFWQRNTSEKFRELSNFDDLTGLYNRRFVFAKMEQLLQNLPSDCGELCLMLADLDDFKLINDKYGHPNGDSVLKHTAEIALSILRPGDVVARIGGEEFMMLLPRTTLSQAKHIAERWRKAVDERPIKTNAGELISVSTSIGIASFGKNCMTAEALYSYADQALYKAKHNGKNKAEVWKG